MPLASGGPSPTTRPRSLIGDGPGQCYLSPRTSWSLCVGFVVMTACATKAGRPGGLAQRACAHSRGARRGH
eukprot:2710469-Alexandrium_andersonii.AAC.1